MDKKAGGAHRPDPSVTSDDLINRRVYHRRNSLFGDRDAEGADPAERRAESSASERANQLPRKIWIIGVAGLLIWVVILAGALLFFV